MLFWWLETHGKWVSSHVPFSVECHFAAYVNGKRQGKIFERPLCIGDSIARERSTLESSLSFLPQLDVESEINLVESSQNNASAQMMKELGLERWLLLYVSSNCSFGYLPTHAEQIFWYNILLLNNPIYDWIKWIHNRVLCVVTSFPLWKLKDVGICVKFFWWV